jgi:hypothetical protein
MKDANADTEGFSDDVNGHCTASGCVAPEHAHAHIHAHRLPRHAVCMTGLERGMPFAFGNVRVALAHLYSGGNVSALARSASFFGVRPQIDEWPTVRAELPPLTAEAAQAPCGASEAGWFSAWGDRNRIMARTFVQVMCDLAACAALIRAHESTARQGVPFYSVARLRLDLAYETPLRMPRHGLRHNAVHCTRMNAKQGINDKWAIGRRAPMEAYLTRASALAVANELYAYGHTINGNKVPKAIAAKQPETRRGGLIDFRCRPSHEEGHLACSPVFDNSTAWQHERLRMANAAPTLNGTRRFEMTSESFLMWALWRANVSVVMEPAWMFCKLKITNISEPGARTCIPRMQRRTPCSRLTCTGGGIDCNCATDNSTCTHYDPRARKNATHWYCQDVPRGNQLSLDGELYGGRYGTSGLE